MHPAEADDLEFDDANEEHLAAHGLSAGEVFEVWVNSPTYVPNKKGPTATWLMLGDTDGGRALTIGVLCKEGASQLLRPITGWDSTDGELTRWRGQR